PRVGAHHHQEHRPVRRPAHRDGLRECGFETERPDHVVAERHAAVLALRNRPRQRHLLHPPPAAQAPAPPQPPTVQGRQPQALQQPPGRRPIAQYHVHTSGLPPPDQGRGGPAAQGGRLRAAGVRRGCQPPVLKVGWLFNDLPLSHNESRTDIVSGSTLVFKRLARQNRGRYRCYAFNEEGRGRQRRTRPQHQP
ncbi:hypothetical protein CEXT_582091, partial [Caerostris extrusa]